LSGEVGWDRDGTFQVGSGVVDIFQACGHRRPFQIQHVPVTRRHTSSASPNHRSNNFQLLVPTTAHQYSNYRLSQRLVCETVTDDATRPLATETDIHTIPRSVTDDATPSAVTQGRQPQARSPRCHLGRMVGVTAPSPISSASILDSSSGVMTTVSVSQVATTGASLS
jgi:hypothetical protein